MLDATTWDFVNEGPIELRGDWEIFPEGVIAVDELTSHGPSTDFVTLPWSEAHHRTRAGFDVDSARWVALRVRIRLPSRQSGVLADFPDVVAESFHFACLAENGTSDSLNAGIDDVTSPNRYREGFLARGQVALSESGVCSLVIPRGGVDRVVAFSVPTIAPSSVTARTFGHRVGFAMANVAMVTTFAVFAAVMTFLNQ